MATWTKAMVDQARGLGIPDEAIYKRILASQAVAPKVKKPNILETMGKALVEPGLKYLAVPAEAAAAGISKLTKTPYTKPYFMSEADLQKYDYPNVGILPAALETTKRIAGAASYVIPGGGGKAASVLGRIATAAGKGALAGGLYGYGQTPYELTEEPQETIKKTIKGTATGAAGGAVAGGLLQGAGEAVKALRAAKVGTKMAGKGTAIKAKGLGLKNLKTVTGALDKADAEKRITNLVNDFGEKTNAHGVGNTYKKLTGQLDDTLHASDFTGDTGRLFDDFTNEVAKNVDIQNPSSVIQNNLDDALKTIDNLGTSPSAVDLAKSKFSLQNEMGSIYRKLNKDLPLSDKEQIIYSLHKTIDTALKEGVPEAVPVLNNMSLLHRWAPDIMTYKGAVLNAPIVGRVSIEKPVSKVREAVGGRLQKVGKVLGGETTPKSLAGMTGAQAEVALGWPQGLKPQFDAAMMQKNVSAVQQLLPQVPQYYKEKFSDEIGKILGTQAISALTTAGKLDLNKIISSFAPRVGAEKALETTQEVPQTIEDLSKYFTPETQTAATMGKTVAQTQPTTQQVSDLQNEANKANLIYMMLKYPKYASVFTQIYKMAQPAETTMTAQEKSKLSDAKSALFMVDVIEDSYNKIQAAGLTAQTGGLGRLKGLGGTVETLMQTSPESAVYKDTQEAFLSRLARASGEKGVLTDYDVGRIRKALPTFYDTPEVAAGKLQRIRQIITGAIETKVAGGGEGTTTTTTEELPSDFNNLFE